jgi:uncharacterized pyridoxamine 5'-phosphate oxidase family protein
MSALDEIIAGLRSSPAFHVATVDAEGKPRVRPFSFVMEYGGHLAFATSSDKKIYAELQKNPYVEIEVFDAANGAWWRVHGKVDWIDDLAAKAKVFEVMPHLQPVYKGPENPVLKVFWVEGTADYYSFASTSGPGPSKSVPIG